MNWIEGKTPDTKEGTETPFWVTLKRVRNGKLIVRPMWYLNKYRMPLNDDSFDIPDCAVPVADDEDYDWTCWTKGECDYCECTWIFTEGEFEIIAYAPAPDAFNK
jgi:hypothetical protein